MKLWDVTIDCTVIVYGVRGQDLDQALDSGLAQLKAASALLPKGMYIDILEAPGNPGVRRWYEEPEGSAVLRLVAQARREGP